MTATFQVPLTARERGKTAPAKLAHVVLRTPQPEAMIEWYKTILEAEVVVGTPVVTFLTYDEEHHRVAIIAMPGIPEAPPMATGVDHIAFTYDTIEDLFATYDRLKGEGIMPFWTINHGPTLSFYYMDPDGNQIELQIDRFDENEATNEWFINSDFNANPIGVKVDPEELIARYRGGEDRDSVLERPTIDPSLMFDQLPTPPPGA